MVPVAIPVVVPVVPLDSPSPTNHGRSEQLAHRRNAAHPFLAVPSRTWSNIENKTLELIGPNMQHQHVRHVDRHLVAGAHPVQPLQGTVQPIEKLTKKVKKVNRI